MFSVFQVALALTLEAILNLLKFIHFLRYIVF